MLDKLEEIVKENPKICGYKEVTTGMREKEINNMERIEREESKRKIKLWAQEDVKISILCT